VYVSASGVRTYLPGTPAATPSAPATPSGGLLLAEISVAAGATSIQTANIVSRKKGLWTEDWVYPTLLNGWARYAQEYTRYRKCTDGTVEGEISVTGGTIQTTAFQFAVGYRPLKEIFIPGGSTGYGLLQITGTGLASPFVGSGNLRFRFIFASEG
jgi:hypothetical protein